MLKASTEGTRPFQGAGPEKLEIMTTMKPFDPRGALLGSTLRAARSAVKHAT